MLTLRDELGQHLRGRVCVVGIGNPDRGDDAFGVRLAEAMRTIGYPDVILAERTPERWVAWLGQAGFQTVLFLDAVDSGAAPGDVVVMEGREIAARYPQISTHQLSLGTLAQLIETHGSARVFLLGVQPECVRYDPGLSPSAQTTLEILRELLVEVLMNTTEPLAVCGEQP
jgi:hydrogenase maturation protease